MGKNRPKPKKAPDEATNRTSNEATTPVVAAPSSPDWKARFAGGSLLVSVVALSLSGASWYTAKSARELTMSLNRPALSVTTRLIEPLTPLKGVNTISAITNDGNSPARRATLDLRVAVRTGAYAVAQFSPDLSRPNPAVRDLGDLNARRKYSLPTVTVVLEAAGGTKKNAFFLQSPEDVTAAERADEIKIYVYGKATYFDLDDVKWEQTFCKLYQKLAGVDPFTFADCDSFRELRRIE
jgi:hypothetical protein